MAFLLFPTRSVDLLGPDGALEASGLGSGLAFAPWVVLARERCRFELFAPLPGSEKPGPEKPGSGGPGPGGRLGGSAALAAARLHALTHAPYEQPGSAIMRKGARFGLWWWDAAWVGLQLERRGLAPDLRVLPEAAVQPPAQGWRVVRGASGYEAQVWDDGFLVASAWRRRPFDAQAWTTFARIRHDAQTPAPEAVPPAQSLPYTWTSAYRRRLVSAASLGDLAPVAGQVAASVLVCATALMAAQGLRLGRERAAVDAELTAARAHRPAELQDTAAGVRGLAQLRAYLDRPDPLVLTARAQKILAPFKLKISAFSADSDAVTFTIPAEAVAGIDLLSQALEASADFTDVRPTLDRQRKALTIRVAVRGRPAPAGRDDGFRALNPEP